MANIIGGFATSHTPTIGFACDTQKQDDPVWKPIFEGYQPVKDWLSNNKPDVIFYIFNDHMTSFFLDHYSHFTLGVGAEYPTADEGGGARELPPFQGHPNLAEHIAKGLVADEFDLSFFQDKPLDHGCFSPMSLLLPHDKTGWPTKIIPLQVGVLMQPGPSARRCYKFGQSLRKAIKHYPEDIKVAVAGTGGLSHQVHGERCGFNNTDWDFEFMERLEKDPEGLLDMTIAELADLGGYEGSEVVMWLIMRGALSTDAKVSHKDYYLPSMCAIATMVFEEGTSADENAEEQDSYLARLNHQLKGADKLEGTYPFTIGMGVEAYRLNKFLHNLIYPEYREAFKRDEEALYLKEGLTEKEQGLVRDRDWIGLIQYGVIFFMLEKLGAVVGVGNPNIYAAMRGETMEEFHASRNANMNYSVAGGDEAKKLDSKT